MGDLAARMNPGVRAPGAMSGDVFAARGADRLLQRLLHGRPIGLPLPADERRAVIFERPFVTGHFVVRRTKIGIAARPHWPGGVKRLRRSFASLRPLRGDNASAMWVFATMNFAGHAAGFMQQSSWSPTA